MAQQDNLDELLKQVREQLESGAVESAADLVSTLHPADGAELLAELAPAEQHTLFAELEENVAAEVLPWLDLDQQAELVSDLPVEELSEILDEMEPDDAADVLGELEPEQARAALAQMEEAALVQPLLEHPDDSAGGIMLTGQITLQTSMSAQAAIEQLRRLAPDEELAYYLYVTDTEQRLVGVVSLRQLVVAPPQRPISAIMNPNVISVSVDVDQEEAARTLSHYGLLALPTVDAQGRLVGVITADDAMDVIEEEATEDLFRLAGLSGAERVGQRLFRAARSRLAWLFVNLPTALLAAGVVSLFEQTIARVAVLAVFMPIIAGMGGNAGIQTLTLIVRSIALGEVELRDAWRALARETAIGVINGLFVGLAVGIIGLIWAGLPILGLVAGLAMLANLLAAAIAGTLVPLGLKLAGIDPALASGVIVTTFTDVTGYGCFLGLATLLLQFFPVQS